MFGNRSRKKRPTRFGFESDFFFQEPVISLRNHLSCFFPLREEGPRIVPGLGPEGMGPGVRHFHCGAAWGEFVELQRNRLVN